MIKWHVRANIFWLDSVILNTDRHFNNYGIIMCGEDYRPAPIFDNGKSLLTGCKSGIQNIETAIQGTFSKSFSADFELNYSYLKDKCTIELDQARLKAELSKMEDFSQKRVLEYQIGRLV